MYIFKFALLTEIFSMYVVIYVALFFSQNGILLYHFNLLYAYVVNSFCILKPFV